MNSFAGVFWLFLAQSQNQFLQSTSPVTAYVRCLKEKEWKKWNIVFIVLRMTFFFVALQSSVGEIRTNYEHFSLKNENKKKRTASLKQNLLVLIKKECILQNHRQICAHLHLSFITLARSFLWFLSPTTIHFYYLSKVSATSKQLSAL